MKKEITNKSIVAALRFKNEMQKILDKKNSGFSSISIQFGNNKPIIIAESNNKTTAGAPTESEGEE